MKLLLDNTCFRRDIMASGASVRLRREKHGHAYRRTDPPLSLVKLSVALAVAIASARNDAQAQITTDIGRAPTLTVERYTEDWSYLSDPELRTGRWTEPFKYLPLDSNNSIYVTTGLEARSRYEGFRNANWGSARDDDYIWHRLMPYADLHLGEIRLFTQPIFSTMTGADRPKTPVDTTGADMLQAFAEIETTVANQTSLRISVGRKLIAFGTGRLVDNRYGPGVPQSFDGIDATLVAPTRQVTAFVSRPVDTAPGDFNDDPSQQQMVWGAYATQWLGQGEVTGVDVYYLGLRDREASFDQGTGRQRVHTFGGRFFGDEGEWYWNLEGSLQRGTFAEDRVDAWGGGGEIAYRFLHTTLQPEVGIAADAISGDRDRNDSTLGTFNPLFPRGKYFGSLTPIGPRNLKLIRPSLTVHPSIDVAVSLTGTAYWRESTDDGIYAMSGELIRSGEKSNARYIGHQIELAAAWQASQELNLSASVSTFEAGTFIKDTGPAQTLHMVSTTVNFRF